MDKVINDFLRITRDLHHHADMRQSGQMSESHFVAATMKALEGVTPEMMAVLPKATLEKLRIVKRANQE